MTTWRPARPEAGLDDLSRNFQNSRRNVSAASSGWVTRPIGRALNRRAPPVLGFHERLRTAIATMPNQVGRVRIDLRFPWRLGLLAVGAGNETMGTDRYGSGRSNLPRVDHRNWCGLLRRSTSQRCSHARREASRRPDGSGVIRSELELSPAQQSQLATSCRSIFREFAPIRRRYHSGTLG